MRTIGYWGLFLLLTACGTPPKEYITWKGCAPGEETTFVACDRLHVVAGWSGCGNPTAAAVCYFNPPPGYVLLDTSTHYNEGPAGVTSYSPATIAEGAKIISKTDLESKYTNAIELAGKWGDAAAEAKLKQEMNDVTRLYDQIETNKNLFRATVTAKAHGTCLVDQKRSWINVTVRARTVCMGVPEDAQTRQTADARSTRNTISCCAPGNTSCIEGSCKETETASCDLDANRKPVIVCTPVK